MEQLQGKLQGRGSQISGWDWLKHSDPGGSEKMRRDSGLTQGRSIREVPAERLKCQVEISKTQ